MKVDTFRRDVLAEITWEHAVSGTRKNFEQFAGDEMDLTKVRLSGVGRNP